MNTKPMLFNSDMVIALLDGRKSMTRRIVQPQPDDIKSWPCNIAQSMMNLSDPSISRMLSPHGKINDLLWVRETFRLFNASDECGCSEAPCPCPETGCPIYRATHDDGESKWTPSIHMPRWASRLTLQITNVRVERLQDISEQDAVDEGIDYKELFGDICWKDYLYKNRGLDCSEYASPVFFKSIDSFRSLWESINGFESWDLNPWVWVIKFDAHQINVDEFIRTKAA